MQVGMDDLVKFGDSSSNGSQDIRAPHFVTNDGDDAGHQIRAKRLIAFCLIYAEQVEAKSVMTKLLTKLYNASVGK